MKKVFLVVFASIFTTVMYAQATTAPVVTDKKADMKDLRTDVRDKRQDERQRAADRATGNKAAAKSMTTDIKAQKADIKTDKADAKADGVKHPVRKADRQIHRQNLRHG